MDFGIATFNNNNTPSLLNQNEKTTINNNGSGFTKQDRSDPDDQAQLFLRTSKSSRTDYFDQPNNNNNNNNKTMQMRSDPLLSLPPADAAPSNHMLSFSSSSSSSSTSFASSSTNGIKDGNQFSFYQPSAAYIRNTTGGYGMQMPISRFKGPFTPSQWMELEHQALIYKHFVANVPVPSHLLNPLRKSLNSFLFPGTSSSTSYAPNSYGWGTFHLGFSGNTDPEPGRCRRTDGKKWRCSRDAVPDQKYCERHINRGRHRSRKPVEGHNGQVVPPPPPPKLLSSSKSTATPPAHNQFKTAITSSTETTPINRSQESQTFALNSFSVPKQHEESSDSLVYPTNYSSFLDQGPPNPNPLPNFVDEWSKAQSSRTAWPEELKPDWTQLSMSIPTDFSSSSNSPAQEKLGHEFDLDLAPKHGSNWIPISWGQSMGGPLGEVLNRSKNGSSSEMWDHGHYQMGSSPTGVLQKTTFVSLSNSSSGSSPKKADDHGGGLCDELVLSTLGS